MFFEKVDTIVYDIIQFFNMKCNANVTEKYSNVLSIGIFGLIFSFIGLLLSVYTLYKKLFQKTNDDEEQKQEKEKETKCKIIKDNKCIIVNNLLVLGILATFVTIGLASKIDIECDDLNNKCKLYSNTSCTFILDTYFKHHITNNNSTLHDVLDWIENRDLQDIFNEKTINVASIFGITFGCIVSCVLCLFMAMKDCVCCRDSCNFNGCGYDEFGCGLCTCKGCTCGGCECNECNCNLFNSCLRLLGIHRNINTNIQKKN